MVKERLRRTAENLEFTRRILVNTIWIAIILIILAALGWFLMQAQMSGSRLEKDDVPARVIKSAPPVIAWHEVDAAVAATLQKARQEVRMYAEDELDVWIAAMMERVDDSFLEWYFSYWTQQVLGLKGLYQYGVNYVLENQPDASEKLTEEVQAEFSQRVLRPQIAQKIMERIINETVARYIEILRRDLDKIPATYNIGRFAWQEYLEDIALTATSSDGSRQTPLSLKALTVSGVGGTALLAGHIKTMVSGIGAKMATTSSGKMASAMAAKTGSKVAAKIGGKFFGAIAGFGVLVWDVWDHKATEKENRPFLRQSLQEYFSELKYILLDDPDFGIMTTFYAFEQQMAGQPKSL